RYRPQHRTADPDPLEHGFRRVPLAMALFSARGGDRDPDLDPDATLQRSAWALAWPTIRRDCGRIAADHRGERIAVSALERCREVCLDFGHDTDAAIDQPAIELQQRSPCLDLGDRGCSGINATNADQRERAFRAYEGFRQHSSRKLEQWTA